MRNSARNGILKYEWPRVPGQPASRSRSWTPAAISLM
jgi:hypothetical protein